MDLAEDVVASGMAGAISERTSWMSIMATSYQWERNKNGKD
jgi:hypothetical protein